MIIFYGWFDIKNWSFIKFLINNPNGTIFLKSIEALDNIKNVKYNFGFLDRVIEEIVEY